ncbi:hypothetical protein [Mucilaginibacter segetis]|uniref:Lipoprotein n=1 Tax=Mucilaginibacter segetis TaxID=2793071 RepID=A0A934PR00_9SPHI|nr:hypothetical protein [Mucilaginibacter segetis]MBK0378031.1 hypothetical protein [Mucilaginibacter segetis]
MKKNILTLIAITATLFSACKKDNSNNPADGNSASYQPFTNGSTWSYRNETNSIPGFPGQAEVDTTINTMTADTKVFTGRKFHLIKSVTGSDIVENYFGFDNHVYYNHSVDDLVDGELELPYLNEETAIGGTWIAPLQFEDAPESQAKGTIVEKDITKVILGKTYNNVIHSKLELQSKLDGQFVTVFTFDFYVAKSVGVIAVYSSYNGNQLSKSELISYNIK